MVKVFIKEKEVVDLKHELNRKISIDIGIN